MYGFGGRLPLFVQMLKNIPCTTVNIDNTFVSERENLLTVQNKLFSNIISYLSCYSVILIAILLSEIFTSKLAVTFWYLCNIFCSVY